MGEALKSEGSIVITDDVLSLPSADDILRSFRKRASLATARALQITAAIAIVARAAAYYSSREGFALFTATTWGLIFGLSSYAAIRARRGELDPASHAVLAAIVILVPVQSFYESSALAVLSLCLGYPVLYLCAMALAPAAHFRVWTRAMPALFAANVLARQFISPLDLLGDPFSLAAIAGGGALGMVIVGRMAEGILRALRHSLAYSESVRGGLERTQRQLVAHQQALEARVRERTRDLEAKNLSLAETLESLQRAQTQLVQSEKMASLGLLVAGIAHEIKNPLNFVNNFAELGIDFVEEHRARASSSAEEVEATLSDVAANLARIREHGRRADGIINAMLMHARDRGGEAIAVDFNALVAEHVALAYQGLRTSDRGFTIEIVKTLDASLGQVMLPYQEISRVVVNLVSNACYAMRERQRRGEPQYRPLLHVGTKLVGREIELSLRDNGTGLSEEVRRRLFDPFFTTKPPGEGTGLGLSICYEIIVQKLGGSISIDPTIHEGARFIVRVPMIPASQEKT